MPALRSRTVFEVVRGIKAFLGVEAGLTRDEEPLLMGEEIERIRRRMAECVQKNSFEKLARRKAGSEDSASFFRKGVAGDWRGVFTERDRQIYEEIAGNALREMGYSLD